MNAQELKKLIEDNEGTDDCWEETISDCCGSYASKEEITSEYSPLVGRLNLLGYRLYAEEGYGGEGKGDQYWGVFSVENPEKEKFYFQISGWYASFNGATVDYWDFKPVKPVETKKIVWRSL